MPVAGLSAYLFCVCDCPKLFIYVRILQTLLILAITVELHYVWVLSNPLQGRITLGDEKNIFIHICREKLGLDPDHLSENEGQIRVWQSLCYLLKIQWCF